MNNHRAVYGNGVRPYANEARREPSPVALALDGSSFFLSSFSCFLFFFRPLLSFCPSFVRSFVRSFVFFRRVFFSFFHLFTVSFVPSFASAFVSVLKSTVPTHFFSDFIAGPSHMQHGPHPQDFHVLFKFTKVYSFLCRIQT